MKGSITNNRLVLALLFCLGVICKVGVALLVWSIVFGVHFWGSGIDLSTSDSANCYIVSESGSYKFKTVKGNSDMPVGDVASAEVLWESFGTSVRPSIGDLVTNVSYKRGYISFEAADNFKEGNAVIAAKDAYGNILWSWHIWLTDQPKERCIIITPAP